MGDAENALNPSKKRAAGREISRDNPGLDDDDENPDQEIGTFKKASEEVLASRRIVKVRHSQTSSTPSSNPFAGLKLAPSPNPIGATYVVTGQSESFKSDVTIDARKEIVEENHASESKKLENEVDESKDDDNHLKNGADESKGEAVAITIQHDAGTGPFQPSSIDDVKDAEVSKAEDKTENIEKVEKNALVPVTENENKENNSDQIAAKSGDATPLSSFGLLSSSQNAFTGVAGTGFSGSTFSFGVTSKDGSFVCGSAFGFGSSNNGRSPIFGTLGESTTASFKGGGEGSAFPVPQEVSLETGEENEKPVFVADSVLFEYLDGGWKERGKGEVKINVSTTGDGKGRLIMRSRGNYRLILNASLFPDMKLTNMEKKGITFACVNSASEGTGGGGLSTFALKFKDIPLVDEFRSCVMEHKGKVAAAAALKTPENSPKASDD